MPASPNYLGKMAQCELAVRFAPAGVADLWRSAADCYLLLAEIAAGEAQSAADEPPVSEKRFMQQSRPRPPSEGWIG